MSDFTVVEHISGLSELWDETLGDPKVCIAILDGPVDKSHPSLSSANLTQISTLVSGEADSGPASMHGTHITSIIFGSHSSPVKGVSPNCRGLIVPVFKDGVNNSIAPCSQLDLARAINTSIQHGANIINISGGELSPSGTAYPLLTDAVRNCAENDVLIIAAAGNDGCECLHVPGALPSVLVVGAMNKKGEPLELSNWGSVYQTQGILAPGENILGATPGGGNVTNTGTSFTTPIVSGIAALLLSIQLKRVAQPDPHAVRKAILNSAIGCDVEEYADCRRLLAGRLNLKGAISEIIKGGDTMKDSSVEKNYKKSQIIETSDYKMPSINETVSAVQPASSDSNSPGVSEEPNLPEEENTKIQNEAENEDEKNLVEPSQAKPSPCSCGGATCSECCESAESQLVFALGTLSFDFGTEARRDSIMQHMGAKADPQDPKELLAYLKKKPSDAASIIWTLNLDATPIYAIQPQGAFAKDIYELLREFLQDQIKGEVERVSIPGYISGNVTLFTGQVVPVITPEPRGMSSWNTKELVDAVTDIILKKRPKISKDELIKAIEEFLLRIYHDFRNLGITAQERAINYAATNVFPTGDAILEALEEKMRLDTIDVGRSPICRPDSDCWDVKLLFFDPENVLRPRRVILFTVDVSDIVPVNIEQKRSWLMR